MDSEFPDDYPITNPAQEYYRVGLVITASKDDRVICFFYASLHFLTYAGFDHLFSLESIIKDAVKHKRIFVGFGTFIILLTLALTSPNKMVKRIGAKRWQAIHRLTYLAAIGGVIHYLWLVKIDIRLPLVYAGILSMLLGCRIFLSASRKLKHRH